jgi:hypothetical protein
VDELIKGLGAFEGPVECGILLKKAGKWFGNVCKPGDEWMLES